MIPSVEVAAQLVPTDTKMDPFEVIPFEMLLAFVLAVQVIPSGEVAALVVPDPTAKTLPFQAAESQVVEEGIVLEVNVFPSVEERHEALVERATKVVLLAPMQDNLTADGNVRAVHVTPSGDVAKLVVAFPKGGAPPATATNSFPRRCQYAAGIVCA